MTVFVGRQHELSLLTDLLDKKAASMVVVKGRRRIGKSRLIEEFAKEVRSIMIAGLAPSDGVTAQDQRNEFSNQMARQLAMPAFQSQDWSDLFWQLANQTKHGRVVILLDEISWMGSKDSTFLGKLKTAWDLYFKKNNKLILVLCGSISSWIEKNIISSTGFMGRITLTITLRELTLPECNEFWQVRTNQISSYEKFKLLSVTGGVPSYLEAILPQRSAEENLKRLCFMKEGFLFNEFQQIFHDLFGQRSVIYQKILQALIKRPHAELNEIFTELGMKKTGVMSEYLSDLIEAGFINRDYMWSIKDVHTTKHSQFRISDNYIRFYLKYILPNQAKINRDAFIERALITLPGWEGVMGLQFENLVLNNRKAIYRKLHIDPAEIVNDNPYFQKKTTKQQGCQIDYLIQTRFNCLYVCEIKFSKNPIKTDVISEVKAKINALNKPRSFSYRPVLIHVNGVHDDVISSEYFADIIDFSELLVSDYNPR